jgi:NAD(P)H dehydrogenase (quinone)
MRRLRASRPAPLQEAMTMILVTGATGRVGYRVVRRLADARAETTAMVRVDSKAAGLPPSVQHVVASLEDPPAAEVLWGFDPVFLLSPASEAQVELEVMFIDALMRAGHGPRVVKLAADGFQDPDCEVRFMRNHRQIAIHLEATGLPVSYVAPNVYMESLMSVADVIRDEGVLPAPAGQGRVGFVAASDVASVAAKAVQDDGDADSVHVVTGPEALGFAEVAASISAVFAHEVDYREVSAGQAREQMTAGGASDWQADGLLELFDWVRHGGCDTVTDEVRSVTGAEPHSLAQWLGELRGAFVGRPKDLPPPPAYF